MTFEEYRAINAINASGLKLIGKSPLHYRYNSKNPSEPTPTQAFGTLVHQLILEPDKKVEIIPVFNKRTKAGKAEYQDWLQRKDPEKLYVTLPDLDKASTMKAHVKRNPYAAALLADGVAEETLQWKDSETGVDCKARLDFRCNTHSAILDVKTANDASDEAFAKACANYDYHVQAAFYTWGAEMCGHGHLNFIFVVVESEPPHGVALYQLDPNAMHRGHVRMRELLDIYAECHAADQWPSYPQFIQQLVLPRWAK